MSPKSLTLPLALLLLPTPALADTLSVSLKPPTSPGLPKHMGTNLSPPSNILGGGTIEWDAMSLLHNGKPFIPIMGEFHYSRYPQAEWRDELLKMKAGGINLISTYVFWIHHEEEKGKFTWDGDKDLHKFIETCKDLGLPVIVRIGPWCHGEVRNGGFPDWVQALPRKRTNDPDYLAAVKPFYDQVGQQLKGLYWKDAGPIVGIQFENEFKGPAAHLVTLKQMATAAGIDAPIYTRTAWDNATAFPAFGEVLPLWGGYAEGFWDRTLDTMPGNYWNVFQFAVDRAPNNAMGSDPNAIAAATARGDTLAYPYLTCELGGGMMSSYHRRIDISPMDIYATTLCKIGSGSNMPGYYMYHGGTNPDGKLSYLMESQAQPQNMWNDMPVKNYDFGAILGACGEVRESYHLTRMLHLFLQDWGDQLARMPATIAGVARNKTDTTTARWAVRSDGQPGGAGFLFVNNYQRAQDMPAKPDVRFSIKFSATNAQEIPDSVGNIPAVTIPANSAFIWPINMNLGSPDALLVYATAQPLCKLTDGDTTYMVFAQTAGVPANFEFARGIIIDSASGKRSSGEAREWVTDAGPTGTILSHTRDGKKQIIIMAGDQRAAYMLSGYQGASHASGDVWKGTVAGKPHIFFTDLNLTFDAGKVLLDRPSQWALDVVPALENPSASAGTISPPQTLGVFQHLQLGNFGGPQTQINVGITSLSPIPQPLKPAGSLRAIPTGSQRVAAEPTDADFDQAASWKISLPPDASTGHKTLRLHYTGDVARIYLGDKLILDDFYNGKPLDLALWRLPAITDPHFQVATPVPVITDLTVKILPLQKNAPIYFAKWPTFEGPSIAKIDQVELLEQHTVTLQAK